MLLASAKSSGLRKKIKLIVLMITNEPTPIKQNSDEERTSTQNANKETTDPFAFGSTTVGALVAPVATLDRTRKGLTEQFRKNLRDQVTNAKGQVRDDFSLREDPEVEFPLGWMLSTATRKAMDDQIRQWINNEESEFRRLLRLIPVKAD